MIHRILAPLVLFTLGFLASCGGGGSGSTASSSTSTTSAVGLPSITSQPASLSVAVGASASFSVVASSTTTLSYQWRHAGTAISGATSATFTLDTVAATDAGDYDVVVSNAQGSTTSAIAVLTVSSTDGKPVIITSPTSQSVAAGGTASFSVTATGSGTLSYQWRKDGSAISGATASSHTISAVNSDQAGSYDVVVSNTVGSATSAAATLSVTVASSTTSATLSANATTAAQAFLATLSTSQQASVQLSYTLAAARHWSNLPASMVSRNGVSWGALSTTQKAAARTLISTALSSTGNELHLGLQAADDALVSLYKASSNTYGSGHYHIAFLGTPSASSFWILQLTGHHLTYNIAFNGSYSSATPMFLGVEPKGSFTLNGSTYDPMAAQRTAVSSLAASLSAYSAALLSGSYDDLLFGANGSGGIDGTLPKSYPTGSSGRGVAYSALSSTDQAKVQAVIKAYVNTQATAMSDSLLAAYLSDTALASTYVAYAGAGSVSTQGSYFRVDGPRVWIEFSVQNGVIVSNDIHYHTIWRDKLGDYGGQF